MNTKQKFSLVVVFGFSFMLFSLGLLVVLNDDRFLFFAILGFILAFIPIILTKGDLRSHNFSSVMVNEN